MLRNRFSSLLIIALTVVAIGCGDRVQVGVRKSSIDTTTSKSDDPAAELAGEIPGENEGENPDVNVEPPHPALLDPTLATEKAPEKFQVKVATTKGDFVVEVTRKWAPNGVDRFYNLVDIGYFTDIAIFRAVKGFVFQFGIHGNPSVARKWGKSRIPDDRPIGISNDVGYMTFAKSQQPNSRTTQLFINLRRNSTLNRSGFVPFGIVIKGFDVLEKINTEYGEVTPDVSVMLEVQGNSYVKRKMPNCDFIKSITMMDVDVTAEETETAPIDESISEEPAAPAGEPDESSKN